MPEEETEFNPLFHLQRLINNILASSGYPIVENVTKLETIVEALGWLPKNYKEECKKISPDPNAKKYRIMGGGMTYFVDKALAKFKLLYKIVYEKIKEREIVGGA